MQPELKRRSANRPRSTTGCEAPSVRFVNAIKLVGDKTSNPSTVLEYHPSVGAFLRAISNADRETASKASETRSSFRNSPEQIGAFGSRTPAAAAENRPGVTLIRNSQCQE